MKFLPVILTLLLPLVAGCGSPLSRPAPSESQFAERFLGMLSTEQVQDLRLAYRGAIGGEGAIARFTTDASGIEAIRAAAKRAEVYKPDEWYIDQDTGTVYFLMVRG